MIFLLFLFKMYATSHSKYIDRTLLQNIVIYILFKLYGSTKETGQEAKKPQDQTPDNVVKYAVLDYQEWKFFTFSLLPFLA